jgi:regulator of replication initiation timing
LNLKYLANGLTKEKVRLLEKQLRAAKAEFQARLAQLGAENEGLVAENEGLVAENKGLVAENKGLVAELQHAQERLATIREAARPTSEIEGRARTGASGIKRPRIPEERNDTGSSTRASKRPKELSERSGETESAAEGISGNEVMSEDDD